MKNKVEEIMKRYKEGIKAIENNETIHYTPEEKEEQKLNSEKIKDLDKDIRFAKISVEKTIDIINNEELSNREKILYNEELENRKKFLEDLEKQKQEIEETEKEKALAKEKEQADKNNEKVILPSGREVSKKEKDQMDKKEIRTITIRELTQESKNIADQISKKQEEISKKGQEVFEFKYEFETDEDGNQKILNKQELLDKRNEVQNLKNDIEELNNMKADCDKYLKELEGEIAKEGEELLNAWRDAENKQPELEPESQSESELQSEPQSQLKLKLEPEQEQVSPLPDSEIDTRDQEETFNPTSDTKYKISIGKKSFMQIEGAKYFISEEDLRNGINLSDEEIIDEIHNAFIGENEYVEDLIKQNKLDRSIIHSIIKLNSIDGETKLNLMNAYVMSNNQMDVTYDFNSLSKVSLWNRLFNKELTNQEKYKIVQIAKVAEKNGLAHIDGEYKIGFKEKLISKITGNRPLALPTSAEMEAAYEYNENLYGKEGEEFKDALKVSKEKMTSREAQNELNSLANDQQKQQKTELYKLDNEGR